MARKCPRCRGLVMQTYASEQPRCASCGWEDYNYSPPKRTARLDQWGGTQSRLRYVGTYETDILAARRGGPEGRVQDYVLTLTMKSIPRSNGIGERLLVRPLCPFCPESPPMEHTSISNRSRRKQPEERYRCPSRHMVGLISASGATGEREHFVGWK